MDRFVPAACAAGLMGLVAGCGPSFDEQEATWLQGAYFDWVLFNHRVSYLHYRLTDDDQLETAIIGGTSTTNVPADLDDGCDPGACAEVPFIDRANVRATWGRVTTTKSGLGAGTGELVVGSDGGSTTIEVDMPSRAGGDVSAVLRGFRVSTDHPLQGEAACYRPEYGWHPRNLYLEVGDVAIDDGVATVDVTASFAAGPTGEGFRACIDEVYERAQVVVGIDVLVVSDHLGAQEEPVASSATYSFDSEVDPTPPKQEEAAPEPLTSETEGAIVGWSVVGFDFDFTGKEEGEGLGAYLRTWGFEVGDDGAVGVSTNRSPGTQIEGTFDYTFDGIVRVIEVDGSFETGTVEQTIDVALDDDDDPVLVTFPLE